MALPPDVDSPTIPPHESITAETTNSQGGSLVEKPMIVVTLPVSSSTSSSSDSDDDIKVPISISMPLPEETELISIPKRNSAKRNSPKRDTASLNKRGGDTSPRKENTSPKRSTFSLGGSRRVSDGRSPEDMNLVQRLTRASPRRQTREDPTDTLPKLEVGPDEDLRGSKRHTVETKDVTRV